MNWHIGKLGTSGFLFLGFVYLMSQDANSSSESPEELFDQCVDVAGKSFCDFLFERGNSPTNVTTMPDSQLESINNTDSLNLPNSTYMTYNNDDLGFRIQHPSDWTIDKKDSQHNTVVGFDSPDNIASVDIRIFPKGEYKSIKDFGDENFKESEAQTLLGYYRNSSTLLSGNPAFKALYLTTYNPSLFEDAFGYQSSTSKAMFTATMVPEKKSIYAIAYFANPTDFDDYLPVIEKMVDSFQIYGKGPVIQEDNSSSISPD